MRVCFIIPNKVFFNGKIYEIENSNCFGGFCDCGGLMFQRGWVGDWLMISECESCWKFEAFLFKDFKFVERFEIDVFDLKDFLKEFLAPSEYEALVKKVEGNVYNYGAFSRAKKKVEGIGLDLDYVLDSLSIPHSKI